MTARTSLAIVLSRAVPVLLFVLLLLLFGACSRDTATPQPTAEPIVLQTAGERITPENAAQIALIAHCRRSPVYNIAWSPDQQLLGIASFGGGYLFNARTLKEVRFVEDPVMIGMQAAAFSPDGRFLASGSQEDNRVWIYEASTGKVVLELRGHDDEVESVAFSPDGTVLATASRDATIRLWRLPDGKLLNILRGHARDVLDIAFSPDGRLLASASWDNTARLWRVSDGKLLNILWGHTKWVRAVAFSPDGELLASGSWDGSVRLWRVSDGTPVRVFSGLGEVETLSFSPDGNLLAVSESLDHIARLLRASDGSQLREFEGFPDQVLGASFSPDGTLLALGSLDGTLELWGLAAAQ